MNLKVSELQRESWDYIGRVATEPEHEICVATLLRCTSVGVILPTGSIARVVIARFKMLLY